MRQAGTAPATGKAYQLSHPLSSLFIYNHYHYLPTVKATPEKVRAVKTPDFPYKRYTLHRPFPTPPVPLRSSLQGPIKKRSIFPTS